LIVGSVIAGCLGLYGYEQTQETEMKNGSREAYAAVRNFKKHFVLSLENIREGRYYVMITSSFAHANGPHLLFNMMGLWGFGTTMVQIFGVKHFALIWMGSALVGSVLQLGYWQKTERRGIKHEAVGASGALFGIMSALSVIFPRLPVALIIIPMSLRTCMALSVALSLGAINQGWLPSLGHVDHLGGMAFGFLYALVALRRGRVRSPF
jgi:membrane associated rhomboid family serine protease